MRPAFITTFPVCLPPHLPLSPSLRPRSFPARHLPIRNARMSLEAPPLDEGRVLFVKAGPDGASMGDCPFSQKANLAMRFNNVEQRVYYIDLANKPDWFLDLNEDGTTPVFVDATHAIGDSDEIVEYSDRIGSIQPPLMRESDDNWDSSFDVVSPIFGTLARLLKNKDPEQEAKVRGDLSKALFDLDKHLGLIEGPFLLGDAVCALDCNLAPKLQHVKVAASHYKDFDIPAECDNVNKYISRMHTLEEWKATACDDEVIIWGWSKFFS